MEQLVSPRTGTFFKRVTLGGYTKEQYLQRLRSSFEVSDRTNELLSRTQYGARRQDVDLWVVEISELGFSSPVHFMGDMFRRAIAANGFLSCPNEVGPALWMEYEEQPEGEVLMVGMDPIIGSDDSERVFVLQRTSLHRRLHWGLTYHVLANRRVLLVRSTTW